MKYRIVIPLVMSVAVTGSAQDVIFSGDFEWGDTGDWSAAEPPRCDRVDAYGRGLYPTSEIHVATWGNNTIIDPENWILRILQETVTSPPYTFEACRDGVFVNNLVVFERGSLSTYLNIGADTAPETFTFASNLWYAWDNPAQSQPTLPVTENNGIYGQDPQLEAGYRIGAASPAAGSGETTSWTWGDFSGSCYESPPSRGAFEVR